MLNQEDVSTKRKGIGTVTTVAAGILLLTFALGPPALAAGGDLDPSFGNRGKVTTLFPDGSYAKAVAIQSDGKIVAVGQRQDRLTRASSRWPATKRTARSIRPSAATAC